jgi:hypothetical protein
MVARFGGTKNVWSQESHGKKAFVRVSLTGSLSNDDHDMNDYRLFTYRTHFFSTNAYRSCFVCCILYVVGCCMGSRTIVCFLSRGAINHPTIAWQNYSNLQMDSRCDNVFLEHRLAVELRNLGMLDKIFPVLIGDPVGDVLPAATYGKFFESGER